MVRVPQHDPEHGRRVRVAVGPIRPARGPEALEGQAHCPDGSTQRLSTGQDRGEDRPTPSLTRVGTFYSKGSHISNDYLAFFGQGVPALYRTQCTYLFSIGFLTWGLRASNLLSL